jgi:hypothetical protein
MNKNDCRARLAICIIAFGFALIITGPKLFKMALIEGWIPGADVTHEVITQMGVEPADLRRSEDSYWVSWVYGDVRDSWHRRERVPREVWQRMREGDPIEVVHIFGSSYLREGVFVEPGQFALDIVFLAAELTVGVVMLVQIRMRRRR